MYWRPLFENIDMNIVRKKIGFVIDIDKDILRNIDIDIDNDILENIDIDMDILERKIAK